tara:strand:- start:7358 stop:7552 length:195 start_codon:yes stop_codon:yes gene_type:complete
MWLLLLVQLSATSQPYVLHVEVLDVFDSERKCMKKVTKIPKKEIPKNINMGCVQLPSVKKAKNL